MRSLLPSMLLMLLVAACTPTPNETLAEWSKAIENAKGEATEEMLEPLDADSRLLALRLERQERLGQLVARLKTVLKDTRPINPDIPGLLGGSTPTSNLLLVRDGHAWRIDLGLSGVTWQALREYQYPVPW